MNLRSALRLLLSALVAITVLLTACADDAAIEATDDAQAAAQITETSEREETDPLPSDQVDLDAILLRLEELPDGWQEMSTASAEGGSCLDALFGAERPLDPQDARIATFGASANGPFLAAWAVAEPEPKILGAVNDVVIACDGETAPSGFTTTIDARQVPGMPANSLSVHGNDENADGARIEFTLAGAGRDRATVVVFAATPLGEIDDAIIADAVNAMVARIPS